MVDKHNKKHHFESIIFLRYFYFSIILFAIITLCFTLTIHILFKENKLAQNVADAEEVSSELTKKMYIDASFLESISHDDQLLLNLREFNKSNTIGKVRISSNISTILQKFRFSHSEIVDIALFSNYENSLHFTPIYPVSQYANTDFGNYLNSKSAVMVENYSVDFFKKTLDSEKMAFLYPIFDYDSTFLGTVCINISKDRLYSSLMNNSDEFNFMVLNGNGKILISEDLSTLGTVPKNTSLTTPLKYNASGGKFIKYEGQRYLLSYSKTNEYGWKVLTLMPASQVYVWSLPLILFCLLLIIIISVITLLYSHHCAAKLSEPLAKLSIAMQNSSHEYYDKNIIEISSLYNYYNELLETNSKMMEELEIQYTEKANSDLRALIAQINPHFLYNTLSVLLWKAMDYNCPELYTIIGKLGKLCRMTYNVKSLYCSIKSELDSVCIYMDLQKECFNNTFDYKISIPCECSEIKIPKFIIQPIVENSIIHGFSQSLKNGEILISVSLKDNLEITIKDNGAGISPDDLEKINSGNYISEKYGIYNINKRIKLICGEEYGLFYSSHILSGTTVQIKLPRNGVDESNV